MEKKPRSSAQVAAFARAKAARENNLRKKFLKEQEDAKPQQQPKEDDGEAEEDAAPPAEDEESMSAPAHTPYVEDFQPIYDTPAAPAKGRSRKQAPPVYDEDIIELDTDALFSTLESQKQELKELREHIHGLRQGHEELQSTWQQHDVSRRSELSFV
jgi:hypothetical protein